MYTGLIFLLPCQASGMPPPRIQWYKNGEQLAPDKPRTSVLSSGELLSGDCTKGEVSYMGIPPALATPVSLSQSVDPLVSQSGGWSVGPLVGQ